MNDTTKHSRVMGSKSILILILLISIAIVFYGRRLDANAQETKGGSRFSSSSSSSSSGINGGGQFFRLKENIQSLQQQQQQLVRPLQVVKENTETISSSSFVKQPVEASFNIFKETISQQQQQQQQIPDSEPTIYGSVQGVPGIDFPGFTTIPNTQFSCEGRPFDPGMYADESTGCQVYHLCYSGRRESFLCGIGTVFNQAIMNCDFWHSVDCSKSSEFYHLNSEFGKASAEPSAGGSSFSSKQEVSTTFNRLPPVPVGGKTSFSSEKYFNAVQINPPPPIVTTSSFSSRVHQSTGGRPVSPSTSSLLQTAFNGVKGSGLTFRGTPFLSPGRQVQLTRSTADSDGGQLASASSNRVKVRAGKTSGSSLSSASFKVTADEGSSKGDSESSKTIKTDSSSSVNEIQPDTKPTSDEWRPYFKGKTNQKESSNTSAGSSDGSLQPATMGSSDQDPVFSSAARDESKQGGQANSSMSSADELPKIPKSEAPLETISGAVGAGSTETATPTVGVEPDVGPILETTTPSLPDSSSSTIVTTGAPQTGESSTTNDDNASKSLPTTTTTTTTTSNPAKETDPDESSVEYVSSSGTTTTNAPPSSVDETAKRRRKRKKKKRNE